MIGVDAVIVVAMDEEAAPFVDTATCLGPVTQVGNAWQRIAMIGSVTVLLVRSGIGPVTAAAALASALAVVRPRAVISAGSAGGLGQEVRVGDVVVAGETLYSTADATAFGYVLGQVPGMPARFVSDVSLVSAAAGGATPDIPVRRGLVISSQMFVTEACVEDFRHRFPQALATDMESAGLAQVAFVHGVPFVSVRGISDLCGPTAGVDHTVRVDDASVRSATVVGAVLAHLAS